MAGEFALIEHLLRQTRAHQSDHPPILGPGDDCALVDVTRPGLVWAVTTDMLVSGVHFLDNDDPHALGWKTLAVNLSDLAAMGAQPRYVTLAAAIPPADASDTSWIDTFFSGFMACAQSFKVDLIGGDTTRGPRSFSVTAMGEVDPAKALRRSGARDGDDIWVSGSPGYAALGLGSKLGQWQLPEPVAILADYALHHPEPRVALGLALTDMAHSAIDISDGLLQDLGHIAVASQLQASLFATSLPDCPMDVDPDHWQHCLLGGGDDYELLFTAPTSARERLQALSHSLALPLTRIGIMHVPKDNAHSTAQAGRIVDDVQVLDHHGHRIDLTLCRRGFDHFANS